MLKGKEKTYSCNFPDEVVDMVVSYETLYIVEFICIVSYSTCASIWHIRVGRRLSRWSVSGLSGRCDCLAYRILNSGEACWFSKTNFILLKRLTCKTESRHCVCRKQNAWIATQDFATPTSWEAKFHFMSSLLYNIKLIPYFRELSLWSYERTKNTIYEGILSIMYLEWKS